MGYAWTICVITPGPVMGRVWLVSGPTSGPGMVPGAFELLTDCLPAWHPTLKHQWAICGLLHGLKIKIRLFDNHSCSWDRFRSLGIHSQPCHPFETFSKPSKNVPQHHILIQWSNILPHHKSFQEGVPLRFCLAAEACGQCVEAGKVWSRVFSCSVYRAGDSNRAVSQLTHAVINHGEVAADAHCQPLANRLVRRDDRELPALNWLTSQNVQIWTSLLHSNGRLNGAPNFCADDERTPAPRGGRSQRSVPLTAGMGTAAAIMSLVDPGGACTKFFFHKCCEKFYFTVVLDNNTASEQYKGLQVHSPGVQLEYFVCQDNALKLTRIYRQRLHARSKSCISTVAGAVVLLVLTTRLPAMRTGFDSPQGRSQIFTLGNRAEECRCSAGFLRDFPFPPPLHSGAAPYSPHITHIGSHDLAVKGRADTHIQTHAGTPKNPDTHLHTNSHRQEGDLECLSDRRVSILPGDLVMKAFRCYNTLAARNWESWWTMPLDGGFSRGTPIFPALPSGAAPYSPRFTFISSQDLAVRRHPNLFPYPRAPDLRRIEFLQCAPEVTSRREICNSELQSSEECDWQATLLLQTIVWSRRLGWNPLSNETLNRADRRAASFLSAAGRWNGSGRLLIAHSERLIPALKYISRRGLISSSQFFHPSIKTPQHRGMNPRTSQTQLDGEGGVEVVGILVSGQF
ncbi:hypothetical protein PR048_027720 [Dryococelus australis]|uniref:Uncharacterized protein n=1 Tax=Dryococelus australis TaxID=614101 RepID=A0ABQ9GHA9_9NEOP|nr:hypothetical protein PR048_027720 [Dryococelus australis]